MIIITIFEYLPADENYNSLGSLKMLSAVEINIDEDNIVELNNDLILNGFLDFPKKDKENNLKVISLSNLTLYSYKSLDEIKSIIETLVEKYFQ